MGDYMQFLDYVFIVYIVIGLVYSSYCFYSKYLRINKNTPDVSDLIEAQIRRKYARYVRQSTIRR